MAIRTAKLADLIARVEHRLVEIMTPAMDRAPREPLPPSPPEEPAEEARAHLAVVPLSDQPELPIPSPAVAQPPPIALVRTDPAMEEVAFAEPQPAVPVNEPKAAPPAAPPFPPAPVKAPMPTDPLAAIMTLSEEERIALFT
jgi:hypothetical protein